MKSMNHSIPTTSNPSTLSTTAAVAAVVNGKVKTGSLVPSVALQRRDPLSNITNNVANLNTKKNSDPKKGDKAMLKSKTSFLHLSKKSTGNMENDVNKVVMMKTNNLKTVKSDPMIIDEEPMTTEPVHDDIDQHDFDDPQAVVEYVNDIYQYLMAKEKDRVDPRYMASQSDINEKMRAILVDWLVEVHRMFKLLPETLFLCVSIIDRYLSMKQVNRDMLQLVGITCMLIASKYEEIYAPECNDFVYISDGAYTKPQILQMEQNILNTLNFNITHPSSLHFLRRYSKAAGSDYTLHTICKYLIELVLIDVKFLKFPTSLLAAASVYLGRAMTTRTPLWTSNLEYYSTYPELVVRECALEMNDLLKKSLNSSLKAIRKKYSLPKFGQVAELPLVDL